jgi:hypothetical protein
MNRAFLLLVVIGLFLGTGCTKRHKVSDFPFKPGLTYDQLESVVGSPTKRSAHWCAYELEDGNEIRIFFLQGKAGGIRTLTQADIYNKAGVKLKDAYRLPK